jgi:hypothetical protein
MAQGFPGHGVRYVLHSFGHVEIDVVIQHNDTASEHSGAFSLDGCYTVLECYHQQFTDVGENSKTFL